MERGADRRHHDSREAAIQRSLSASWKEGVASQVLLGTMDSYLVPFALFLGATGKDIGFLAAFPSLLGSLSQLVAVRAVDVAGNRRRLLILVLIAQFLFLLPMPFLPYLHIGQKILYLTALVTGFRTLGSLMGPAWGSLVSEYLPADRRGDYFGWRSRIVGVSGLAGMAFWGIFLWLWNRVSAPAAGFVILFLSCTLLRVVGLYYMSRLVDLPMQKSADSDFTFWMFLRRFRESNFVKFVIYFSAITFAIQLAVPYFSVYMLKELHFNYLSYMIVSLSSVFAGLVSFTLWGRHADAVGTVKILKTTGLVLPLSPLLWLIARNVWTLTAAEFFSGFIWGGFNLCATNFIYDAASPAKRVRCLSYFNLISGTAAFGGAALGGILSEKLPHLAGSSLAGLFLLSAVLRLGCNLFLSPKFREVRETSHDVSQMRLFFSVVGFRPVLGRNEDLGSPMSPQEVARFGDRRSPDRRQANG